MMASKSTAALKRAIGRWGADQAGVLTQRAFQAWKEERARAAEAREAEQLAVQLAQKKSAALTKTLGVLEGSTRVGLLTRHFRAWEEAMREAEERKAAEALAATLRAQRKGSAMQACMQLAVQVDSMLLQAAFCGWQELYCVEMVAAKLHVLAERQAFLLDVKPRTKPRAEFCCWRLLARAAASTRALRAYGESIAAERLLLQEQVEAARDRACRMEERALLEAARTPERALGAPATPPRAVTGLQQLCTPPWLQAPSPQPLHHSLHAP